MAKFPLSNPIISVNEARALRKTLDRHRERSSDESLQAVADLWFAVIAVSVTDLSLKIADHSVGPAALRFLLDKDGRLSEVSLYAGLVPDYVVRKVLSLVLRHQQPDAVKAIVERYYPDAFKAIDQEAEAVA